MLLEEMSDEDLIFLIQSGSKLAETVFYKRYSRHATTIAKKYVNEFNDSGITEEDFYAVAFAKTYQALINYKNMTMPFKTYWNAVVKNSIYDYVRANSYKLGARSLSGISLDENRYTNNESLQFHDVYGENESDYLLIEYLKSYVYGDKELLNPDEKLLAHLLFFEELTPKEIIETTGWNRARYSYLVNNVKRKIGQILKRIIYK